MKILKSLFLITGVSTLAFILGMGYSGATKALSIFSFFQNKDKKQIEVLSSNVVLKEIQEIQELATAEYNMETVVSVKAERFGKDNKLLYIANGKVKAGLDLYNLTVSNIKINDEERKIIVELPPSKILDKKINVNTSQIYQYDEGWFTNKDVAHQMLTKAQQNAEVKMLIAACKSKIIETANQKAEIAVDRLLTMTGYEVEVIPSPVSGSCNLS